MTDALTPQEAQPRDDGAFARFLWVHGSEFEDDLREVWAEARASTDAELRAALRERSREVHYVTVRMIDHPACSGDWEDCPQPICARDRALLKGSDR